MAVPGDAGGARVDHVPDAGHGQRRLGDVGGEHDPPSGVRGEDLVLVGGRQPRVERHDLGAGAASRSASASWVSRISRSPARNTRMSPGPSATSSSTASRTAVTWSRSGSASGVVRVDHRAVAHLDRVGAAGDLDDRRAREVGGHPLDVDRRRGDDELQVGTPRQQLGQVAQQEVDVEAPLVGLVEDDRVVLPQHPVVRDLGEQHAVGHELDQRAVRDLVAEAHLVADDVAQRAAELLGDALGDAAGGDPARLGVADPPAHAAAQLERDLRQLGGLARAGLPGDDHDLRVPERGRDVVAPRADRELLGVGDHRDGGPAAGDPLLGGGHVGGDALPLALARLRVAGAPQPVEPAAQPVLVGEGQAGEPGPETVLRRTHRAARVPLGRQG